MRKWKLAVVVLAVLALYALAGFLAVPALVKPRLVEALEQATHRSVHLAALRVNPFTFSATLEDFRLLDRDSTVLLSFKVLYARYRITSVFRHVWSLAQFRLDTPYVAVRVLADGRLSVNDLLSEPRADSAAPPAESPRPLELGDFRVTGGTIVYQDLSRGKPFTKMLDSLDLGLQDFTTVPQKEGTYEFEALTKQNERLRWRGTIALAPLRSTGVIELSGLRVRTLTDFMGDALRFEAASGSFSARADYALDSAAGGVSFALRNGRLDVSALVLTSPLDSVPPVSVPSLHAGGISLDYPRNTVTIDTIHAEGGSLRTAYLADGTMTLQEMLTPRTKSPDSSGSNMRLLIRNLSTRDLSFLFVDRTLEPEAPVALSGIDLNLTNFWYGKPGVASLSGRAVLNGGGSLGVNGTMGLEPRKIDLDLAIEGSPLPALAPWVQRYSRAELLDGTYGLRGKFSYALKGKASDMRFRGNLFSDHGRVADPVLQEDLVRWGRIDVRSVEYLTFPASLRIAEIVATRPYARVIIGPDRSINLQHLRKGEDSTAKAGSPSVAVKKDTVQQSLTTIGRVSLKDGSLGFADFSLSPNFDIGIQQLQGSITGLSSKQLERADVDLAGNVQQYAPVTIKGKINPLSDVAFTDIMMKFEKIDLTTFTPYFSKFAGYKIRQGKLSLDLQYKLNARHLDAQNKIYLDQLTLGDKVESPDATSLPVKLAIALLKDSRGVIDLDVPISGSLDDPEFSIFPIILKVLMNLLWKMVTAPFALLGALFGGSGDELQYVQFDAGLDSLAVDQHARLDELVKGLNDRPALQLEVKGTSCPVEDRQALAEAEVLSKVRQGGMGPLTRAEEKRLLEYYRSRFNQDPEALLKEGTGAGLDKDSLMVQLAHRRLVDSVQVSDNDLRALAQRRAAAIMDYLSRKGGIDPSRVFLVEVDTGGKMEQAHIRTTLNLTAR